MNLMQLPDEQKNQDIEVDVVLPLFSNNVLPPTDPGFSFNGPTASPMEQKENPSVGQNMKEKTEKDKKDIRNL